MDDLEAKIEMFFTLISLCMGTLLYAENLGETEKRME